MDAMRVCEQLEHLRWASTGVAYVELSGVHAIKTGLPCVGTPARIQARACRSGQVLGKEILKDLRGKGVKAPPMQILNFGT